MSFRQVSVCLSSLMLGLPLQLARPVLQVVPKHRFLLPAHPNWSQEPSDCSLQMCPHLPISQWTFKETTLAGRLDPHRPVRSSVHHRQIVSSQKLPVPLSSFPPNYLALESVLQAPVHFSGHCLYLGSQQEAPGHLTPRLPVCVLRRTSCHFPALHRVTVCEPQ